MLSTAFAPRTSLREASRLPAISRDVQVSAVEIGLLLACGALSAVAVGMLQLRMGVPGHAILRGVVPMALGLALVPRRSAGTVMAGGASVTAALMLMGGFGRFQPAALLSMLLLGPVLDVALIGRPTGWRLYARFIAAGVAANCAAFATRFAVAFLGYRLQGGRQFMEFWHTALGSFVICGAIAGLVSAALWFRLSSRR
jgi:hypothetical protein